MQHQIKKIIAILIVHLLFLPAIVAKTWDFNETHDRSWIGEEFFSVPLEDWQIKNGRVECTGNNTFMRVNLLSRVLKPTGNLHLSAQMGLINSPAENGSAGFRLGMKDETDNDIRSLCFYGDGIDAGIKLPGTLFIKETRQPLPENFDIKDFNLSVSATESEKGYLLKLIATDTNGSAASVTFEAPHDLSGIIAFANNFKGVNKNEQVARFWFDDIIVEGSMVEYQPENNFGPVLFNMYTLSHNVLKMSVQMPPIGEKDTREVELQVKNGTVFSTVAKAPIRRDSRIAVFKVENWDDSKDHVYRVVYNSNNKTGDVKPCYYNGTIRKNPDNGKLEMAGMTCQHYQAYPYRPLVENVAKLNPDILYFSGDQIYEANGGYPIIRDNPEKSIVNYLGKWFMFGWAFGDLMKNRPTICIPDDHEVYQGNIWGAGGERIDLKNWKQGNDDLTGFVQPPEMINVVMQTNTAHLHDAYNPKPMKNNIPVYYTDLVYGNVSFAIVGDRVFKSGPDNISWWDGRKDHITFDLKEPERLENDSLKFLGNRQLAFLDTWSKDWKNAEMKCVLSQTIFSNTSTHHGAEQLFLYGDMDSGGWPKSGRDKAVEMMRKTGSLHVCGDQHIGILQQYGLHRQRDANWVFCTPAISVGYQRRFLPDRLNRKVMNRPLHGFQNTGEYQDVFKNYFFVWAVGNPKDVIQAKNRYEVAQERASGFGYIIFDTNNRRYTTDAIPFLAPLNGSLYQDHFPGWPLTISQSQNFGTAIPYFLPKLIITGTEKPVLQIFDEREKLVWSVRLKDNNVQPKVWNPGVYSIKVGNPETENWKIVKDVKTINIEQGETINIQL